METDYTVLGRYPDNEQTYATVVKAGSADEAIDKAQAECAESNDHDPGTDPLEILFVFEDDILAALRKEPFANGREGYESRGEEADHAARVA